METSNFFGAPVAPPVPAAPAPAAPTTPAAPVQTKYVSTYSRQNLLGLRVEEKDGKVRLFAVMAEGGPEIYVKADLRELTANPEWRSSLVSKSSREGGTYLEYCPNSYYVAI